MPPGNGGDFSQDPGSSGASARFLAAIEKAHGEVEPCLAALDPLIAGRDLPETAQFSATRFRLGRANLARTQVAREACGHLLANGPAGDGEALRDLQRREVEHAQMISEHIQRWPPQRVQTDWQGYRITTRKVLDQVRELIAAERTILLPLLRRLG